MTNKRAKPDRLNTFNDFNTALMAVINYDGIGFLVGHDICGIDLDDCFDSTGNLKPIDQSIVDEFSGCYMEYSPSGNGLHIYFKVGVFTYDKTKYYINNQKIGVEVYVSGVTNHFVTVTGNVYCDGDLLEKRDVLRAILDKYMLRPKPMTQSKNIGSQSYLSDESVVEKASASVNGERFKLLWKGDRKGYASHSEADLALCSMLAFWCGSDVNQKDRLFRQSGLMRNKWDRTQSGSTYGMITINKAISSITEVYKPGGKRSSASYDFLQEKLLYLTDLKPDDNERYPWTDIGSSRLFSDYYQSKARYVPERKMWFCYEGGIWSPDIGNLKVMELCKSLADQLLNYALSIKDE